MSDVSAVLLVGGKSSRMGRAKEFVEVDGALLWQRQIGLLEQLSLAEIFISGPRKPEWSRFAVIEDAVSDAGPLGGIVAALRVCRTDRLLVLAVDLPGMRAEFLRELRMAGDAIVPTVGGFYEPLAAVYPKTALALAEANLQAGAWALQPLVAALVRENLMRTRPIAEAEKPLFRNLNTPADLAACQNG